MKNVTLAAINSKFIHSSLAVRSLKAAADIALSADEYKTVIAESSINDSIENIIYGIMQTKPDIVGFSVYIWNVSLVEKICKTIKAVDRNIKIILGGPEVSYGLSHTSITEDDYDALVKGEGERAFTAAVMFLGGQFVPSEMASFSGKIFTAEPIEDLDEIPFVYNEENIAEFENKIIYYESSRGCPFSCAYCLSSVCGKVRSLSLERVRADIDFFVEHNVAQVKFVDRTFNCNSDRAYEIWKHIYSRSEDSRTNFHFEIGADLLTDRQIELLRKMPKGKIQLEAGIQSTNEEALEESCRNASNERIFRNIRMLKDSANINLHTDLIAGLPYENFESFKKSFNQVYALGAHQLQLGFLKLLSGAPLNEMTEKHGYAFTSYPPYEVLKNDYISFEEIQRLKEIEDVVERLHNSGRFALSLKALEDIFDTPFEMFEKIADFLKEKNLIFAPVASKKLYDLLNEFAKNYGADITFRLLKDFYLSENSEILPESLKFRASVNKDSASKILKDMGLSKEKKVFAKFNGSKVLIIDYSDRNPVNGRYKLLFEWMVSEDE